jgi:hypothetical protein
MYYVGACQDRLRKPTINTISINRCPSRYSNVAIPEYMKRCRLIQFVKYCFLVTGNCIEELVTGLQAVFTRFNCIEELVTGLQAVFTRFTSSLWRLKTQIYI